MEHVYWCAICNDGGNLLLCDTCPKTYHKDCINLEEVPDGHWECPKCVRYEKLTKVRS